MKNIKKLYKVILKNIQRTDIDYLFYK